MRTRTYKTQGIVLARKNYSESDRILSIYSRDLGRITLLAKGVRKLKSRKRGHIEIFSHITFQAARGKGIDILTEVEILDNFVSLRRNLKKVSLAYYFMEVIGKITYENEVNEKLFLSIIKYFHLLENSTKLKNLRLNFILELLTDLGYWPKGKDLINPDAKLTEVLERNINSVRVGKKLLS